MKPRAWITLFVCVCLLRVAALVFLPSQKGDVVEIYQNRTLLYTIHLDQVSEPYDIELENDGDSNTIHVIPGDICITHASCPDQVCVKHGCLSSKATPIVCLPNKIVIQYSGSVSETVDAVAGGVS